LKSQAVSLSWFFPQNKISEPVNSTSKPAHTHAAKNTAEPRLHFFITYKIITQKWLDQKWVKKPMIELDFLPDLRP
jgi:hypothetical protein